MYTHATSKSYYSNLSPLQVLRQWRPQTENIWEQPPLIFMIYAALRGQEGQYEELGYYRMKKPVVQDLHSKYTQQLIFLDAKMSNLTSNKLINNFKRFHSSSVSFSASILARLWRSGSSRAIS